MFTDILLALEEADYIATTENKVINVIAIGPRFVLKEHGLQYRGKLVERITPNTGDMNGTLYG